MTNQRSTYRTITILLAASASAFLLGCATDESQPTARSPAKHMQHGQEIFAKLDADQSGTLTPAELEGGPGPARMIAQRFAEIDANRDGALTHDEIATAMERHHGDHAEHHAKVVEQFDTDRDGELDATEREAAHRYLFDQADADDSGTLSPAELATAPGPGPMMAEHLAEIDANGDGALGYEEITAAMEAHHRHHP